MASNATLDELREAIAAAGVEGAFALVRSLPHRVFDAELPGDASLAALGLEDGLTLVAMPADARPSGRDTAARSSRRWAMRKETPADVDGMDYEELLELQERIGTATDERAAAAAAAASSTTFEVSEADAAIGRAERQAATRRSVCGVHGRHRGRSDVLRRDGRVPRERRAEARRATTRRVLWWLNERRCDGVPG